MSMSTSVVGFRDQTNKTFQKHKKVALACFEAGVDLPAKTAAFFGKPPYDDEWGSWGQLENDGLALDLTEGTNPPAKEWQDEGAQGYEVDIRKLPEDIKVLRFYNAY